MSAAHPTCIFKLLFAAVWLSALLYILLLHLFIVNAGVMLASANRIMSRESLVSQDYDCVIIPGASVRSGSRPSPMLEQRLSRGVSLYHSRLVPKLLMSGDHASDNYNEVRVMKKYAVDRGVYSGDVFVDHWGLSTYQTISRAKYVFHSDRNIVVSQKYHLYRALYIARELGMESYGLAADEHRYRNTPSLIFREVFARYKDFYLCLIKPKPQRYALAIPLSGNGDMTNER